MAEWHLPGANGQQQARFRLWSSNFTINELFRPNAMGGEMFEMYKQHLSLMMNVWHLTWKLYTSPTLD